MEEKRSIRPYRLVMDVLRYNSVPRCPKTSTHQRYAKYAQKKIYDGPENIDGRVEDWLSREKN